MSCLFSIGDLVKEVHDMASLMAVREASGGADDTRMLMGMTRSICAKINTLRVFKAMDALQLTQAIKDCLMQADAATMLHDAIAARLTGEVDGQTARQAVKANVSGQMMLCPYRYLTGSDWTWVRAPRHDMERRLVRIVARLVRLGIRSLDGPSTRTLLAMLVHIFFEEQERWPEAEEMYDWGTNLSRLHMV